MAHEPVRARLAMLEYNLKHLGMSNVVTTRYTGQNFPLRCKFTRVLVDVPCSGEGNYRCDMQGRVQHMRRAAGTPDDLPRLQKQLLIRGFDILAPGGSLIYATCTYNPAEHEAVVQELLEQRPAILQPITLPVPHSPGLIQWKKYTYDVRTQHCWRLYPHQTGSVGFFVASIHA